MSIKTIVTEQDYIEAKALLLQLEDTNEADTLRLLIENYELRHTPDEEPDAMVYMDAFYLFCEGMLIQMAEKMGAQAPVEKIRQDNNLKLELMRDHARLFNTNPQGWKAPLEGIMAILDHSDHAGTTYRVKTPEELEKHFNTWLTLK